MKKLSRTTKAQIVFEKIIDLEITTGVVKEGGVTFAKVEAAVPKIISKGIIGY